MNTTSSILRPKAGSPNLTDMIFRNISRDPIIRVWRMKISKHFLKTGSIKSGSEPKVGDFPNLIPKKNQIQSFNESFSDFTDKPLRVIAINQSKDGKIWIGTWGNGVFVLDPKTEKVTEHFEYKQPVQQIIADQFWNIWFISGNELMKFDPSEDRLIRFSTGMVPYNLIEDTQRQKKSG